jgi:indoleamine 2,3-dioxygenase
MQPPTSIPLIADYDIDRATGFVGVKAAPLPESHEPWITTLADLPYLLSICSVHSRVGDLPVLSIDNLRSYAEYKRAYVTLGYLIQAYIWEDRARPKTCIPPALAEPFVQVCERLGTDVALSYHGSSLGNWEALGSEDQGRSDAEMLARFESIRSYASFTGSRDEDAFTLVPTMVEAKGARVVPLMLDFVTHNEAGQLQASRLKATLHDIETTFTNMEGLLQILHQNCDPGLFYNRIRPLLAGSSELPDGVTFQLGDGSSRPVMCVGASAGQSAFFQFLDHMLGIHHQSKMLVKMRRYMTKKHRDFLELVDKLPSIRDLVGEKRDDDELQHAFERVLEALRRFRTKHVAVVTRYVVQPGNAAARTAGKVVVQEKGTAGTLPIPFLKTYRDETI